LISTLSTSYGIFLAHYVALEVRTKGAAKARRWEVVNRNSKETSQISSSRTSLIGMRKLFEKFTLADTTSNIRRMHEVTLIRFTKDQNIVREDKL